MERKKIIYLLGVIVFGILLYSVFLPPLFLPYDSNIPERDIVFSTQYHIGFINADGSGLEIRDVKIPVGLFTPSFPLKKYSQWHSYSIHWNETGDAIGMEYFYYVPAGGTPLLIDKNNHFYFCPPQKAPRGGNSSTGGMQIVGESKIVAVRSFLDGNNVFTYDMKECKKIEEIYKPEEGSSISNAVISKSNWLAIWRWKESTGDQVVILSPENEIQTIINDAKQPAWSRNGEYLAFVKEDGLYIVSKDGKVLEIIAEGHFYCPAWSPDGEQIVVQDVLDIAVVEIESGNVKKIVGNGYCPDWR